ncbi:MAG: radical SAM protein [Thermodesulfobacteriota bacterium]
MHERLSCEWIEGGLAFAPRSAHACCVVHHETCGWPLLFPYDGGPFDVGRFQQAKRALREALAAGKAEQCRECPLLTIRPADETSPEFTLRKINLSHFTRCNLRCAYCYLQKERIAAAWWNDDRDIQFGHHPLDLGPVFRQFMESGFLSRQAEIFWGGGEPTLMPGFEDLLLMLLEYGPWVTLTTNATIFNRTMAEASQPNLTIICSVDAGSRETYRHLKQSDRYEAVWENLAGYAEHGKTLVTKYILLPENTIPSDIVTFLERSGRLGVHHVVFDVDAFQPQLTGEMESCLTLARRHARELGLEMDIAGCGAINLRD